MTWRMNDTRSISQPSETEADRTTQPTQPPATSTSSSAHPKSRICRSTMKPIEIDGCTGEGGGQLVRNAIALAACTSLPVKITNVRGNRPGIRNRGLKSQHFTSIEWLAKATGAEVKGLEIGSETLEFRPSRGPGGPIERSIKMSAESPAASALLIFQAVFPFLLFASNEANEPIELEVSGGTNVYFSPSYEYLDQVLLPTLERQFGIHVDRKLQSRGWSSGNTSRGSLWFKIQPLPWGSTMKPNDQFLITRREDLAIKSVDATIIAPSNMHDELEDALRMELRQKIPDANLRFEQAEDSGHNSRLYVVLVAKSENLWWGRDVLHRQKRKGETICSIAKGLSTSVIRALLEEIRQVGTVDKFLQDQLVIFQALAEGKTSFPRIALEAQTSQECHEMAKESDPEPDHLCLHVDKVRGPLGESEFDSTHTTTARWVISEILEPRVKWYNRGTVCQGIGLVSGCGAASE